MRSTAVKTLVVALVASLAGLVAAPAHAVGEAVNIGDIRLTADACFHNSYTVTGLDPDPEKTYDLTIYDSRGGRV